MSTIIIIMASVGLVAMFLYMLKEFSEDNKKMTSNVKKGVRG
jgi:hypothetical protein